MLSFLKHVILQIKLFVYGQIKTWDSLCQNADEQQVTDR
jgi:hypothetical protein